MTDERKLSELSELIKALIETNTIHYVFDVFLDIGQVEKIAGISRSLIDLWEKEGKFPKRYVLARDCNNRATIIRWRLSEIMQWIRDRTTRLNASGKKSRPGTTTNPISVSACLRLVSR